LNVWVIQTWIYKKEYIDVDWIDLAKDKKWNAVVKAVMNLKIQ